MAKIISNYYIPSSKIRLKSASNTDELTINILDTVREPLIVLDRNLIVLTANRSFYNVFKVKPEVTIGRLLYDLGNGQWNIPKLRELLETILPDKTTFDNYEVEHAFSTIGKRIMLLNARQIEQALGKEKIILLAIEDITDRKEVEAGLEKTRKELAEIKITADEVSEFTENIIDTIRKPLLALDQDLRVVKASRSFYEYFNATSDETIGTLIYNLGNHQWNIPQLRELLEAILPNKKTIDNFEVVHDFSTIGKRTMLLNAQQIERTLGKEKIILLSFEDITERKQSELIIQQQNQLYKEQNATKDKFFSIIAHDLKSPFQSFLGMTEIMAENTEGFSLAEFVERSKSLNEAARHLYKLLENLLEWAQVQKGSISYVPIEISLSTTISQNIEIINQRALQKGIIIINEVSETQTVFADQKMIDTVLRNLLSNAVKFTRAGGKVVVKSTQSNNGTIEVSIADDGIGIDEKDVKRLFKIEEKISKLGTDGESSTGLGLLLCKEFVEMHGGKIWVESKINKGSIFYFTIHVSSLIPAIKKNMISG